MSKSREERITRLTEEFRRLLLEKFPEKGSSLERIEELTEEIGRAIEERIEEDATKQEGRGYAGNFALCECGDMARYVRDYDKRIVTLHGERTITRSYYHCGSCGKGFCPIDETLGLDGGCTSVAVRARIARLAAMVPFGRCSTELSHLCGIKVSAKTVERVAEMVGSRIGQDVAELQAHVLSGEAEEPKLTPDRLYVTTDGVMAPMKEGYRECKVGAVYEAKADDKGDIVAYNIEHAGTISDISSGIVTGCTTLTTEQKACTSVAA